jgi:hypothetical protein
VVNVVVVMEAITKEEGIIFEQFFTTSFLSDAQYR